MLDWKDPKDIIFKNDIVKLFYQENKRLNQEIYNLALELYVIYSQETSERIKYLDYTIY